MVTSTSGLCCTHCIAQRPVLPPTSISVRVGREKTNSNACSNEPSL